MEPQPFQECQCQVFALGAALTGVLPNGVDIGSVGTTARIRGRYRRWDACTDGGLFQQPQWPTTVPGYIHRSFSARLRSVIWNLPGITNMIMSMIDMDGVETPFWPNTGTASTARGWLDPQQTIWLPHRGSFKIIGTGNLSGVGSIRVEWDAGWQPGLEDFEMLGSTPISLNG